MIINLFDRKEPKSVVWITLHKCASQFFGDSVLPRVKGLSKIDYQWLHYENRPLPKIDLQPYGHIYGPVRLLEPSHPSFSLTEELLKPKNLAQKRVIIMVRDPRDLLVSMYYSFGFSHPLSPNPEIGQYQQERRTRIQPIGLDEYARLSAPHLAARFERLGKVYGRTRTKNRLLLTYEEMVLDFDSFYRKLSLFLELEPGVRNKLFNRTRPEKSEHPDQHKRNGAPGGFQRKLSGQTIEEIERILGKVMAAFRYGV
jgi:hypothetical protein